MEYREVEKQLKESYNKIKNEHSECGQKYIKEHWKRYVTLLTILPPLNKDSKVLEVGASILSSHLYFTYGCNVTVVFHELEVEWKERFLKQGIKALSLELMRDPLPVTDNFFDLILFNEVIEHFPLDPSFFLYQLIGKLSENGIIVFSVPNFATSEKRLQLLCGKNPQDMMDKKYVYYAHHREPVMNECIELIKKCGGEILSKQWLDMDGDPAFIPSVKRLLFNLSKLRIHSLLHFVFPSMRKYIVIKAKKSPSYKVNSNDTIPPLSISGEYNVGARCNVPL
ncbi:MAG: class I SAM-dependent methyltransferase, partial [Chitinispirillaceae bacterium]|nr:class I SAM-dependent methyltransferase [Chitinispirillaceae bacterium]